MSIQRSWQELARFLVAGSVNTVGTYVLYLLLLQFFSYMMAFTISFVAGVCFGFVVNRRFVFNSDASWRSFLPYAGLLISSYLLNVLLIRIAVNGIGLAPSIAPLPIIPLSAAYSYLGARLIFRRQDAALNWPRPPV